MLLIYQILLIVIIAMFAISAIGDEDKNRRLLYTLILIAAFISELITFTF